MVQHFLPIILDRELPILDTPSHVEEKPVQI